MEEEHPPPDGVTDQGLRLAPGLRPRAACLHEARLGPEPARPIAERRPAATAASTASEATMAGAASRSPSRSAAQPRVRKGWSSCTWPTRERPPRARPRYQSRKARYMLTTDT